MIKDDVVRRSVRLLAAIHELHKQGYQNLAVYCSMSPSGCHWRLSLMPYYDLYLDQNDMINFTAQRPELEINHSSGQDGNEYFGWQDTRNCNARELAEKIKERFPELINNCKGNNFEYAGWFTYMLGEAEKGNLPLMFLEFNTPELGFIFTTKYTEIIQPPHQKLNESNGRKFIYKKAPHLKNNSDWHTAHKAIIDDFRNQDVAQFPEYPILTNNIKEIGSYWEGAIYYIDQIMGYHSISEFLQALEGYSQTSERWSSFFAIYDSQGQLIYLKAFLVRYMLNHGSLDKSLLTKTEVDEWTLWLKKFEKHYGFIQNKVTKFHNPYFGGNNPLHLGNIFYEDYPTTKERLIYI